MGASVGPVAIELPKPQSEDEDVRCPNLRAGAQQNGGRMQGRLLRTEQAAYQQEHRDDIEEVHDRDEQDAPESRASRLAVAPGHQNRQRNEEYQHDRRCDPHRTDRQPRRKRDVQQHRRHDGQRGVPTRFVRGGALRFAFRTTVRLAALRNPLQSSRIMSRMPTDFRDGKTFPRRGRESIGEALWLLRVADKGRAAAAGTIHDYIYPCPMDQGMMERWGITPASSTKPCATTRPTSRCTPGSSHACVRNR